MKILFWGNGDFGVPVFKFLTTTQHTLTLLTMPPRKKGRGRKIEPNQLMQMANQLNIPILIQDDLKDFSFANQLKQEIFDWNIVVDYGKIIPESILNLYPERFVNIHPSLLPVYRGASPIQTALLNGDTETGVTLQKMVKELDAGDILVQKKILIDSSDNYETLSHKLMDLSCEMMAFFLEHSDSITPKKQEESRVSFCHKFQKIDFTTDWNEPAEKIHNKVRAFSPNIGLKTIFRNKILKIFATALNNNFYDEFNVGEISNITKKYISVKSSEGSLNILSVQPQDKRVMSIQDFINGYKPQIGEKLRSILC